MEHKSFEQLHDTAVLSASPCLFLERDARLMRWADLLEREPGRRLATLDRLEFVPRSERPGLRTDGSPIAVAFADPFLRASGLTGDTYGDARAFFGLSERQAHRLLCSCLNGPALEGRRTAAKLRTMASRRTAWDALVRAMGSGLARLRPARPVRG